MLTYKEFKDVQEHNPLAVANIIKKINPLSKLQDKLTNLKKKGIAGVALDAIKKKADKLNPFSDMNKARTMAKKKDLKGLKKQRDAINQKLGVLKVQINDLEDETRKK